jgi:hypothetical protein
MGGADQEKLEGGKETECRSPDPYGLLPEGTERSEWGNAYLEECERRNTLSTFKEKRDGFRRFTRYLAKT